MFCEVLSEILFLRIGIRKLLALAPVAGTYMETSLRGYIPKNLVFISL